MAKVKYKHVLDMLRNRSLNGSIICVCQIKKFEAAP